MGTTTNCKLLKLSLSVIYEHSVGKENLFVMFITKQLKLFLKQILQFAIPSYLPFPISPFDISSIILITKSENCAANELAK